MSKQLDSYLKTHRKRAGLTQQDVAILLGYANSAAISRLERRQQAVSLPTALGYHIVLDQPLVELVPGVFREIDTAVIERATHLLATLEEAERTPRLERRLETIEHLRMRAKCRVTRMYEYTTEESLQARLFH